MVGVFVDSGCDVFLIIVKDRLCHELSMDDVRDLFIQHGRVMKVIFDTSLPGRAWIVSCTI